MGACLKRNWTYETQWAGGGSCSISENNNSLVFFPAEWLSVLRCTGIVRKYLGNPFKAFIFPGFSLPLFKKSNENERFDVTEMQFLREGMAVKNSKPLNPVGCEEKDALPEKLEVVLDWINLLFFFLSSILAVH